MQGCDNVPQLRAFIGAPGVQVYLRGYTVPGDGGQGDFAWNVTANGRDDGGVTAVVPQPGVPGAWIRLVSVPGALAYITNIASLEAITSALLPGTQVFVEGYYTAGDGGGGLYVVGTSATANGGTIVNDASGRSWYLENFGQPVSVKQFGAYGNGTNDDTAAIQAAIAALPAGGGVILAPEGTYRVSSTITITAANITLLGQGIGATTFASYSGTGNWFSVSGSYSGIRDCTITSAYVAGGSAPTAGFAIVLSGNALYQTIDSVLVLYAWNGIQVAGTSEVRLNRIYMRYLFGTVGIQTYATSAGNYRCVINDLSCYNPYPTSITLFPITWSASLGVTAGQIAYINNAVYQCTKSGTTASSGAGPNSTTSFTAPITDGTAQWKFVCNDLTWVEMNSFSYSLVINEANLIYGVYGLAMRDTLGSGTSWPNWCFCWDLECDHNFSSGVSLEGGAGFWAGGSWVGSQLAGNGIQAVNSFLGEMFFGAGSRLVGAAQHGALIEVGFGYQFRDLYVAANSISSDGAYNGITFAAGVTDFSVNNMTSGPNADINAPGQNYGICVNNGASNYYDISHNDVRYNVTRGVYDGGTGANKVIAYNLGSDNNLATVDYLSSGTIMQNGAATSGSGGTVAVTWPVPFPTACKTVVATVVGSAASDLTVQSGTFTKTGTTFTGLNAGTGASGIGFTWIALGY